MGTRTGTVAGPPAARLRGTGFGRLWLSAGSANLGDGVLLAGLPVLATTVTDSPAAIAGVTFAFMLPMVLSALPAGALADRADRRAVLVRGNAGRAVALVVLVAVGILVDLRLALIYAAAVAAASCEVLVDTTAQTAVPGLVPGRRLEGANARLVVTQVVGNDAVGAPIGAALAALGAVALLGPSAALYAVAALAATRLRLPAPRPARGSGPAVATGEPVDGIAPAGLLARVRVEVADGLTHLGGDLVLRRLAVANALSNLGNTAFTAVFVVLVVGPMGLPAAAYGWLLAVLAVGGLVGGLLAEAILRRTGTQLAIRGGFGLVVLCFLAVGISVDVVVVAVAAATLGAASMITNVAARTLRQRRVPDGMLGRVTASMASVALVATPVGAVVGGVIAEVVGVRAVSWFAAGTNLAGLLLLLAGRRGARRVSRP